MNLVMRCSTINLTLKRQVPTQPGLSSSSNSHKCHLPQRLPSHPEQQSITNQPNPLCTDYLIKAVSMDMLSGPLCRCSIGLNCPHSCADYLTKVVVVGKSSSTLHVAEIMTPQSKLMTMSPYNSVLEAMALMMDKNIRHVPVVGSN